MTKGAPDQVRVTVAARAAGGAPVKIEKVIPVAEYKSAIPYQSPVKGTWLMTIMPGLRSHHRFNPPTEFALDFFRADADGGPGTMICRRQPISTGSARMCWRPPTASSWR